MRIIFIEHNGGAVDYKGEDRNHFQGGGVAVQDGKRGLICAYYGPSDESVWPTYVDPTPVITISDVTGAGLLSFVSEENRAVVSKGSQIIITANNLGPAGVWSTPITAPDGTVALMKTEKVEGEDTMTVTVVLDQAGAWFLTQEHINSKLPPEMYFKFEGFRLDCQLPEA